MMRGWGLACACFAFLCGLAPVWAQGVQTDTSRTVPANHRLDSLGVAEPRGWVVQRAQMRRVFAVEVLEPLQLLPGVQALDFGTIGQKTFLSFRGARPPAATVLLDGVPLLEPIQGSVVSRFLPLNLLNRLTFSGPGETSPAGEGSAFGALAVTTPTFDAVRPYSKVLFRSGDFGYRDIGAFFGLPVSRRSHLLINVSRQTLDLRERKHTGSRVLFRLRHAFTPSLRVSYRVFANKNDVVVPAPQAPAIHPEISRTNWQETRWDQVLSLQAGDLEQGAQAFQLRLLLTTISQESLLDTLSAPDSLSFQGEDLLFRNEDVTPGVQVRYARRLGGHRLRLGGDAFGHKLTSAALGDHDDLFTRLFLRDDYRLTSRWRVALMLELEKRSGFDLKLHPGAHVSWQFATSGRTWAGFQRSRRYPTFVERYWPTFFFQGNPRLQAETGTNAEIGAALKQPTWAVQAAAFYSDVQNWIGVQTAADTFAVRVENLGVRSLAGMDVSAVWRPFANGELGVVGTFLRVGQSAVEKQLQVPEYSAYTYIEAGHAALEEFVFVRLRLAARLLGRRTGIDYRTENRVPTFVTSGPNAILDGQIAFEFKDARAVFSLENLLDTEYRIVPGFLMPDRRFRFSIDWEFWD